MNTTLRTVFLMVAIAILGTAAFAQVSEKGTQSFTFTASQTGLSGAGFFNYAQNDSFVVGQLREGNFGPSDCCLLGGNVMSLRSEFAGSSSIATVGRGLINMQVVPNVFFGGNLVMDGGSYLLPSTSDGSDLTIKRPATLRGRLLTYSSNPVATGGKPLDDWGLNLKGSVTVTLRPLTTAGVVQYQLLSAQYNFSEQNEQRQR